MKKLLVTVALLLSAGCASYSGPVAEDPVCKAEGELGCVRVRVLETTPRATYEGVTYYFCDPRCRDRFLKDPKRYVRN